MTEINNAGLFVALMKMHPKPTGFWLRSFAVARTVHSSLPLLPGLDLLDLLEEDGLFPLINRAWLATTENLLLTGSFPPAKVTKVKNTEILPKTHLVVSSVVQTSSQISSPKL